jgi:Fanconi anemia group M protein
MRLAESFDGTHPKFSRARILLAQTLGIEGGDRVIVFTESRDTAEALTEFLSASFDTRRFVGQGDKESSEGMTQTEQQDTLDAFRNGEFEVLVSTSVAEEGLDVPEVDLVLFFEPVPTAIRSIQRKGRTGRQAEGQVVVLLAEDTRDEAYYWISKRREEEMESELRDLKGVAGDIESELTPPQAALEAYDGAESERKDGEDGGDAPGSGETDTSSDANGGSGAESDADRAGGESETEPDAAAGSPAASDAAETNGQAGLTDFGPTDAEVERADGERTADERTGGEPTESGEEAAGHGDSVESDEGGSDADADASEGGVVATAEGDSEETEIVVDQRELDAAIAKDLSKRDGIRTRLETLAVGDYVLSDRVAVERKSVADFLDTLLDGDRSLFEQVGDLSRAYARPILILEGEGLYEERNVHPDAIRGALASLAVDFDVSVLQTGDQAETGELLRTIATREQTERDRTVSVHGEKSAKTLAEQQEYVVSAIADIGPVTAQSLLDTFGTVEGVMTAREADLLDVDGVGEVTASRIREVVGSGYEGGGSASEPE